MRMIQFLSGKITHLDIYLDTEDLHKIFHFIPVQKMSHILCLNESMIITLRRVENAAEIGKEPKSNLIEHQD